MQRLAVVSAVGLMLALAPGLHAQDRAEHQDALDQGNDTCPAAVIYQAPYYDEGTTVGMANDYSASCGASANAPDVIYEFTPARTDLYSVSLCGTNWDTVLYIREGGVCPGDSEVVCNDDYCGLASTVYATLQAGHTYFIIVDGFGSGYSGPYRMFLLPHPACNFGSYHSIPAETTEYPIDSAFYEHDPNGVCGSDTLPAYPYYSVDYLLGRSFNYYDDAGSLRADEDWYSFGVMEPDTVTATIRAYFPIRLQMLKQVDGCDSTQVIDQVDLTTCATDSIVYPCAVPGDYALRVTCTADTAILIPQFYLLTLHQSYLACDCDTCECDSVTNLTVFLSADHQHARLRWSAVSAGEIFTIYSTSDPDNPLYLPYWRTRGVHTAEAPGVQTWADPDTFAAYQRYVVVRYCP